jgi:hypothetical protein
MRQRPAPITRAENKNESRNDNMLGNPGGPSLGGMSMGDYLARSNRHHDAISAVPHADGPDEHARPAPDAKGRRDLSQRPSTDELPGAPVPLIRCET